MAQRVAVIGAGLAGAACARRLANADWDVEVFEAASEPGGRLAVHRAETPFGEARFDHGAQYVTTQTGAFTSEVKRWMAFGAAETWEARLAIMGERGRTRPLTTVAWVGRPDMRGVIDAVLEDLPVRTDAEVVEIIGEPEAWRLKFADGSERGFYHALVVATPAEVTARLLKPVAPLQAYAAARTRVAPCWAIMAAFDKPIQAPFDAAQVTQGPISWVARNSSKPGREDFETWVIHAAPGWSFEHAAHAPETAAPRLIETFRRHLRAPEPAWWEAHLWPHALVERAADSPFGWDRGYRIGSCGDWRLGPRAELAWRSGDALGVAISLDASSQAELADNDADDDTLSNTSV